jgi:hypothetical protein
MHIRLTKCCGACYMSRGFICPNEMLDRTSQPVNVFLSMSASIFPTLKLSLLQRSFFAITSQVCGCLGLSGHHDVHTCDIASRQHYTQPTSVNCV